MARVTRHWRLSLAGVLLLSALGLSACGSSAALGEARTACGHIETSLATLKSASAPGLSAADVAALTAKAQSQLLAALPFAASATSSDGSYNTLMTTIQEADRVPESLLVASLSRQCHVLMSNTPYLGM